MDQKLTPVAPVNVGNNAPATQNTVTDVKSTPAKPKFKFGQSSTTNIVGVIYGDAGTGKSSLGASFPNPYFVLFEDGTKSLIGTNAKWAENDKGKPLVCTSLQEAGELVEELLKLEECKTIVIDSVTEIDKLLFNKNLTLKEQGTAENKGSWGFEYTKTTQEHANFANKLLKLCTEANKNLIFLAHSELKKINSPDGDGVSSIDKNDIRFYGSSKAGFYYTSIVDFVAIITEKTVVGTNNKKINVPEKRVLNMHDNFLATCKNRFGIIKSVDFKKGENPILEIYDREKGKK